MYARDNHNIVKKLSLNKKRKKLVSDKCNFWNLSVEIISFQTCFIFQINKNMQVLILSSTKEYKSRSSCYVLLLVIAIRSSSLLISNFGHLNILDKCKCQN